MSEPNVYWAGTSNYTPGNFGIEALFPHWTCGGFDGSVATLQNPDRQASAHYVIEGGRVAQLVSEDDSAWHCGNYYYNMRAIAYELVGWAGNPPSYDTLDTCARMMAEASRKYFGGAKLVLGENVILHKWVADTDCPGETDIDWLVNKANEYLNNGGTTGGSSDMFYVSEPKAGLEVHRLYNPNSGEHFYTPNIDERNTLVSIGWNSEGVAWKTGNPGKPIYRLSGGGVHMLTTSFDEASSLTKVGWVCEGVQIYAGDGAEVHRLYNRYNGDHLFTTNTDEVEAAKAAGYQYEGVAFRA